jgi:hypothetical protein
MSNKGIYNTDPLALIYESIESIDNDIPLGSLVTFPVGTYIGGEKITMSGIDIGYLYSINDGIAEVGVLSKQDYNKIGKIRKVSASKLTMIPKVTGKKLMYKVLEVRSGKAVIKKVPAGIKRATSKQKAEYSSSYPLYGYLKHPDAGWSVIEDMRAGAVMDDPKWTVILPDGWVYTDGAEMVNCYDIADVRDEGASKALRV